MSVSEFAFLAIGLVLGVATGAALIEVLRSRPPVARQVRVTVAPNAIQARLSSTLAEPHQATDATAPARGGPGDRRWQDELALTGEPAATGRRVPDRRPDRGRPERVAASGTPVRGAVVAVGQRAMGPTRPAPAWTAFEAAGSGAALVAVPMSREPDPITMAMRASAPATAAAPEAHAMAMAGRSGSSTTPDSASAADPAAAAGKATADGGGTGAGDGGGADSGAAGGPTASALPATGETASGPCAEERRVADERCAVASRARDRATEVAENLRHTQHSYDELVARAETAAAASDPRSVRTAKELAQQRFRTARSQAGTRDDVEAGARIWLAEINRINHDTREAALAAEKDRIAATALGPAVERLAVEADAARITAERAVEACVAAREAVAACDEARTLEAAAAARAGDAAAAEPVTPPADDGQRAARIAAATPEPEAEFAFSTPMNSQGGRDAIIVRILRGEREAMQQAVARLAGGDPDAHRIWQARLGALAEALIARSIEAVSFDFPIDHPFWGPFNQAQNRDIAAGLSSLGFRFDGFGEWVDDHQPSQRDLALAVGYAGLDPMRVRRWPNEAETHDLLREVRVAADEYVAGAAGGLTLGELVSLLGRRADGLTELWNEWGSVRPILLEAS